MTDGNVERKLGEARQAGEGGSGDCCGVCTVTFWSCLWLTSSASIPLGSPQTLLTGNMALLALHFSWTRSSSHIPESCSWNTAQIRSHLWWNWRSLFISFMEKSQLLVLPHASFHRPPLLPKSLGFSPRPKKTPLLGTLLHTYLHPIFSQLSLLFFHFFVCP